MSNTQGGEKKGKNKERLTTLHIPPEMIDDPLRAKLHSKPDRARKDPVVLLIQILLGFSWFLLVGTLLLFLSAKPSSGNAFVSMLRLEVHARSIGWNADFLSAASFVCSINIAVSAAAALLGFFHFNKNKGRVIHSLVLLVISIFLVSTFAYL